MPPRRKRGAEEVEVIVVEDSSEDPDWGEDPTPPRGKKAKKARMDGAAATAVAAAMAGAGAAAAAAAAKASRPKKPPPEKRTTKYGITVRYAPTASAKVQDRIHRALPGSGHRMFLITTEELRPAGAVGGRAEKFTVLGATGNVYDVEISRNPSCTCPDFHGGNLCKHILFVYLRALKLAPNNPLVWQRALLTDEVEAILAGRHSTSADATDCLASAAVRSGYAAATGKAVGGAAAGGSSGGGGGGGVAQRKVEGDCPICFDELREGPEQLSWCTACGNNLHASCCQQWVQQKARMRQDASCVYCRAKPFVDGSRPGGGAAAAVRGAAAGGSGGGSGGLGAGGGYLNLGGYSEAHRAADTSLAALYPDTYMFINGSPGGGYRRRYGWGRR